MINISYVTLYYSSVHLLLWTFSIQVYSFCPETCVWKGEGSFECAGFNAGAVGLRDRIYILGGDYSPDEITDEVQVGEKIQLFNH